MKILDFATGLAIGAGVATLSLYYSPLIGEHYSRIFSPRHQLVQKQLSQQKANQV